jgi:hypothetical protein
MFRPLQVNNKFAIDVVGKKFVIFTDDQTKLPKFNEWTEDDAHTGYSNVELSIDSIDDDTGLFWMSRSVLVVVDPETNLIDYITFSHPLQSISVSTTEGALDSVVVQVGYGVVQVGQLCFASIDIDTDIDGKPDCMDISVPGSLPWLLRPLMFCEGKDPISTEYAKLLTSTGAYVKTSNGKQVMVRV